MSNRGISLIETLLVVGILGSVVFFGAKAYRQSDGASKTQLAAMEQRLDVLRAIKYIRRLGRVAYACSNVAVGGGSVGLECDVDFEKPPVGNLTKVRFRMDDDPNVNELWYQRQEGGVFVTRLRFSGVESIEFCDGAALTGGTCGITQMGPSNYADIGSERYVMYELVSRPLRKGMRDWHYSGAFYMRNPFGAVVYQWNR